MQQYLVQPLGYVARLEDLLHDAKQTHKSALRATAICLPVDIYHLVRACARVCVCLHVRACACTCIRIRGFVYCFGM
jgi:hypothetical protein